jgi:hypothetical protein
MNYWQIAAGLKQRDYDYTEDFLKFGMAFVGWENIKTIGTVECGDRVILKRGMTKIVAVGTVVERNGKCKGNAEHEADEQDKQWLRDYDGLDLAGYCFVEWHQPEDEKPVTVKGLTESIMCKVWNPELHRIADSIFDKAPPICRKRKAEEPKVEILDNEDMLESLIRKGLRPSAAEELTATIRRIRLLARYYYDEKGFGWDDVREHETRTFLIIPFLLALGWPEQQIKIELNGKVDIACFSRAYRKGHDDECVLLLESKKFGHGLDYAQEQGKKYADAFPKCQVVVAANGYCYKAYRRKTAEKGFERTPSAYLNLLRPKKNYPLNASVGGGLELLSHLLPHVCADGG